MKRAVLVIVLAIGCSVGGAIAQTPSSDDKEKEVIPPRSIHRWTGDPALWVKDKVHHFDIVFSCSPGKRTLNINIESWEGQTASAGDLLDTLVNSFAAP